LSEKLNGEGRIPSQVEVVLVRANRLESQDFLPDARELPRGFVLGNTELFY
jgi:hypothetical protein